MQLVDRFNQSSLATIPEYEAVIPDFIVGIVCSISELKLLDSLFPLIGNENFSFLIGIEDLESEDPVSQYYDRGFLPCRDGQFLSPGRAYIIPPSTGVRLYDGQVFFTESKSALKIGENLISALSIECPTSSIGVLLGSGHASLESLKLFKKSGGYSISCNKKHQQNPYVHSFVRPDDLADLMTELKQSLGSPERGFKSVVEYRSLNQLFSIVRDETHVDLSLFSPSLVKQAVNARVGELKSNSLKEYISTLKRNHDEPNFLLEKILNSNSSTFQFTKESASGFAKKTIYSIASHRIWLINPSSTDILWLSLAFHSEYLLKEAKPSVRIFVTDFSQNRIESLSRCLYSEEELASLPKDWVSHFMVANSKRNATGYTFSDRVRKSLVFSRHNLVEAQGFKSLQSVIIGPALGLLQEGPLNEAGKRITYSVKNLNGDIYSKVKLDILGLESVETDISGLLRSRLLNEDPVSPLLLTSAYTVPIEKRVFRPKWTAEKESRASTLEKIQEHSRFPQIIIDRDSVLRYKFGPVDKFYCSVRGALSFDYSTLLQRELARDVELLIETVKNTKDEARCISKDEEGNKYELVAFAIETKKDLLFSIYFLPESDNLMNRENSQVKDLLERLEHSNNQIVAQKELINSLSEQYQSAVEELEVLNSELTRSSKLDRTS